MKNYFILFLILFAFILSVNAQFKMDASGKIVVGDATANPIYRLELKNGDINTEANYGYRINESYILWNNGHPEDLFVGIDAGNSSLTQHYATCIGNLSGRAITSGKFNSFVGYGSGYNNTTGSYNTALGHCAMASNTTSGYNTMLGYVAGYLTTGSRNTYIGSFTGYNNTSGSYNTAIGSYAGYNNTSGNYNTALGVYAGQSNTTGINNTFLGYYAGQANTTGGYSTCVGYYAGQINTTGTNNTFLGYNANANSNNYSNSTAIGNSALVTASHQIRIGNGTITSIGGQVGWTTLSDGRFKTNIQENVKGLEFINKLRPITYRLNTQELDEFIIQELPDSIKTMHLQTMDFAPSSAIIHSGFIAQEVDSVANLCGFLSSIVKIPANNTDPYALSYAEFVVPLVKAVQELSKMVDSLKIAAKTQQNQIEQLQADLTVCCNKPINDTKMGENTTGGIETNEHIISVDLAKAEQIILYQNEPNPFNGTTVIRYYIPENTYFDAFMAFYDAYGKEIKNVKIDESGFGKIEVNAHNVAAGIYTYSLLVNGKVVDTKKMIKK